MESCAGIETAGKRNTDLFFNGYVLKDSCHGR
jgi:hypothetical protein